MSDRRTLSSSLSAMVVQYLLKKDYTQARIARMLGVSEGYISLVKSRERSLTLDHLERLSDWLDIPLGALLMAVSPAPKRASPEMTKFYKKVADVIAKADEARKAIFDSKIERPKRSPRAKAKSLPR
jgi:transcriptional regulator with XRE-family HTH domain